MLSRGVCVWGVRRAGQCAASSVRVRRCIEGLQCVRRSATPSRIKVTGGGGRGEESGGVYAARQAGSRIREVQGCLLYVK